MKVTRAKCAGACYGVQRALNMALDTVSKGSRAVTLGPLIHNPQVVAQLAERGIRAVESPEQAVDGSVIIRSHGVTPQVRREIEARGLPVIDATCPHVARAQKAAAKLARECGRVVVVGEAGHPEVEGLVAYAREAGGEVLVAGRAADVPAGLSGKVGVVVQTTQTREAFEEVLAALRDRGVECVVKDTVCLATRERQESAADLAREVDRTRPVLPRFARRCAGTRITLSALLSSIPFGSTGAPRWESRRVRARQKIRSLPSKRASLAWGRVDPSIL